MPDSSTAGRRRSKRHANAVAEEHSKPLSKRVKTEDLIRDQSQNAEHSNEDDVVENASVDDAEIGSDVNEITESHDADQDSTALVASEPQSRRLATTGSS